MRRSFFEGCVVSYRVPGVFSTLSYTFSNGYRLINSEVSVSVPCIGSDSWTCTGTWLGCILLVLTQFWADLFEGMQGQELMLV